MMVVSILSRPVTGSRLSRGPKAGLRMAVDDLVDRGQPHRPHGFSGRCGEGRESRCLFLWGPCPVPRVN